MSKAAEDTLKESQFLKRKIKALTSEYSVKVKYDFSRYIYVGVKENCSIALEDATNFIATCAGYEAHRLVFYKQAFATNLYVRFEDQEYALAAAERLRLQEGYCVDMVSAMLLSWYLEEMLRGNFPWTLALVNIEGRAEHTDPLSQDVLQGMLNQFGDPRISTYQIGNQVEHVQVLFSSMSEALGASIAHGQWFRGNVKENSRFCYTIKIMGSEKEATLLKKILSIMRETNEKLISEAFEMDYFVQKLEIKSPSEEEIPCMSDPPTQHAPQDFRSSPRVREYRRQFSRGRGNGGRGKNSNNQWQHDKNNSRRFESMFTFQDFAPL